MRASEVARVYGRYEITRFSDDKVTFRSRRPRDWDRSRYTVFDNQENVTK